MKLLASIRLRLWLVVWIGTALHFATNLAREHYPAIALVAHGNLCCDDWAGLHPDLFQHEGHWYANNQVGASLVAAPLLFLFEPLLAKLEEIGRRQAAAGGEPADFDSDYPLRQKFMAEVRRRGLHLRLGATAAITATLVMAPLAAFLALLMHSALVRRGVAGGRAAGLTLLFAFGTPLLFRSAILNHNQLQAVAAFFSFLRLWPQSWEASRPARIAGDRGGHFQDWMDASRFCSAGALAGATVLFDYSGLVLLAGLGSYMLIVAHAEGGGRGLFHATLAFTAGALLPLTLLGLTQWWQFGDPFLPAQRWMPDAHFSVRGWHGFDLPSLDLLGRNLFDPSFGLFAFAPLLLLALLPPTRATGNPMTDSAAPLLPRRERAFLLLLCAAFVLFCAANQFTRLQWNTGMRALAPLVPFLFLAASDRLARLSPRALALVALPCLLHSWVLAMARATPPVEPGTFAESTVARSWAFVLQHGIQLPWLTVLRQTLPAGGPGWMGFLSSALVVVTALLLALMWRAGTRAAASSEARA